MTATLSASQAILKLRYPKGTLPRPVYERSKAKLFFALPKEEDWDGDNWQIALNTENPQGLSADHDTAVGSLAQGNYAKFSVDRKEYWAIARIKAQALKAAESNGEGALVALWKNETEAVALQALIDKEIFLLGNGSGVLGLVKSTSSVGSATITLDTISDISKFSLNMRLAGVTTNTLSPTLLPGYATVTGIDRAAGTLTVSTTWSAQITGITAGSTYLVRAGNHAASGTAKVTTGVEGWIDQSSGTKFGLLTTPDVVRFTGQVYNATGVTFYGEAVVEASARVNQQGAPQPDTGIAHPRTLGNFKKQLEAKRSYMRDKYDTAAGVSFPSVVVEGDEGEIKMISSPFYSTNRLMMIDPKAFMLRSLGPVPRVADFDGPEWLRVSGTDSYECKFVMWDNLGCTAPYGQIIVSNWGA